MRRVLLVLFLIGPAISFGKPVNELSLLPLDQKIPIFRDITVAHKMRLLERAEELLSNPDFFKALPELKFLEKEIMGALRCVASHDKEKLKLPDSHSIIQASGELLGKNHHDLDASDPLKARAEAAFAELTRLDNKNESAVALKYFPNKNERELVEDFIKMIDLDDVPKARSEEFGTAKLVKGSEWVLKIAKKQGIPDDRLQRLVRFGKVLEQKEFDYSDAVARINRKVVSHKDYAKLESKFFSKVRNRKYLQVASVVAKKGSVALEKVVEKGGGVLKQAGRMAAVGGYISAGYATAKLAHNPDQPALEEVSTAFFQIGDAGHFCEGSRCIELAKECGAKEPVRVELLDWEKCLEYFFKMPLHKQSYFLRDSGFYQFLVRKVPTIKDVHCEYDDGFKIGNGKKIEKQLKIDFSVSYFDNLSQKDQVQTQKLVVDRDNKDLSLKYLKIPQQSSLSKNENTYLRGTKVVDWETDFEMILFSKDKDRQDKPSLVERCQNNSSCDNILASNVKAVGMLASRSHRAMRFLEIQNKNIVQCCLSKECRQFFETNKNEQSSKHLPMLNKTR